MVAEVRDTAEVVVVVVEVERRWFEFGTLLTISVREQGESW